MVVCEILLNHGGSQVWKDDRRPDSLLLFVSDDNIEFLEQKDPPHQSWLSFFLSGKIFIAGMEWAPIANTCIPHEFEGQSPSREKSKLEPQWDRLVEKESLEGLKCSSINTSIVSFDHVVEDCKSYIVGMWQVHCIAKMHAPIAMFRGGGEGSLLGLLRGENVPITRYNMLDQLPVKLVISIARRESAFRKRMNITVPEMELKLVKQ
ncbi:hypothetical protein Tco_0439538 [Tanacetum coccineum]